jgi:LPXTG-motif cell wall-anchored protein
MKLVRLIFNLAAVLSLILGCVWVLQGIGVLPGSFMTGETAWAVYGGLLILVALAALVALNRRRHTD